MYLPSGIPATHFNSILLPAPPADSIMNAQTEPHVISVAVHHMALLTDSALSTLSASHISAGRNIQELEFR